MPRLTSSRERPIFGNGPQMDYGKWATGIIIMALNTEYYSVFNWLALVKAVYVEHNKYTKYVLRTIRACGTGDYKRVMAKTIHLKSLTTYS